MNNLECIIEQMKQDVLKDEYTKSKTLITFIAGPGSGKSTIAKKIQEKLNWYICSNDVVRENLRKANLSKENTQEDYEQSYNENQKLVAAIAFPFQDFLFENDISFILDANLMLHVDTIASRAKKYGYKFGFIEILCDKEEALKRINIRKNEKENISTAGLEDYELYLRQCDEYKGCPYIIEIIDSQKDNIDEKIQKIIKKINQL